MHRSDCRPWITVTYNVTWLQIIHHKDIVDVALIKSERNDFFPFIITSTSFVSHRSI